MDSMFTEDREQTPLAERARKAILDAILPPAGSRTNTSLPLRVASRMALRTRTGNGAYNRAP